MTCAAEPNDPNGNSLFIVATTIFRNPKIVVQNSLKFIFAALAPGLPFFGGPAAPASAIICQQQRNN